jgi:hypothetical protein
VKNAGLSGSSRFLAGAHTARAKVHFLGFIVFENGDGVNIGHPHTFGMTHRMTDIITKLRCFTADIALQFLLR